MYSLSCLSFGCTNNDNNNNELLPEVSAQPVWRNIASQHSSTMRIKQIMESSGKGYGHRQRTRPSYQVDQGSCTYPQGRSLSHESRRGQLSVESCLRPLSWCDSWSSHQDSEELSTSFFWWNVSPCYCISAWLLQLSARRLIRNDNRTTSTVTERSGCAFNLWTATAHGRVVFMFYSTTSATGSF